VDGNGRFVYLDPYRGAQLAVAEASRNVACAGGQPIGATNCLNFGNPQRPEIMWQFAQAVQGMGDACRTLGIPITGGNVSLYNETDGNGVLPTPVLGMVGLIEDADRVVRRAFRSAGDVVVLLGASRGELGGSEYLKVLHGLIRGEPPSLDLAREAALQRVLVEGAAAGVIRSAHDCAEGGLAITLAECCFDSSGGDLSAVARSAKAEAAGAKAAAHGVDVDLQAVAAATAWRDVATLFGESASRAVVSVTPHQVDRLLAMAAAVNLPAARIGSVGGDRIRISIEGRRVLDEPLDAAERIWSTAIESYFERRRAVA
jgi:phosphoribosylformylglycinamidine synthase